MNRQQGAITKRSTPALDSRACSTSLTTCTGTISRSLRLRPTSARWRKKLQQRKSYSATTNVLKQKLSGRKRYPLVLMLEPLFRCNLACAGCGKIQYPAHILKAELSPE